MTLRKQILTTVALTLACGIVILYGAVRGLILHSFSNLEESILRTDMDRAREGILWELRNLDKTGSDWAEWDETRDFVLTGDPEYIKRNLMDLSLTNLNLNFMVFVNNDRQVVYAKAVALTSGTAVRPPEGLLAALRADDRMTKLSSPDSSKAGVLLLPEGLALAAARPITNNEGSRPIQGTLILGRYFDSSAITELAARTRLDLEILRADSRPLPAEWRGAEAALQNRPHARPEAGETYLVPRGAWMDAYEVFPDIYGAPGLLLRIAMPRTVLDHGKVAVGYFLVALVLVGAAMLAAVLALLRRFVVDPVDRLTRHAVRVGRERDLDARIQIDTKNELATLGDEFNKMLDALRQAMTDLRKAEEAARLQQQQLIRADRLTSLGVLVSGVAHEVNNPNQIVQSHVAPLLHAWEHIGPILERYYRENGDFDMGGMTYESARTQVPAMLSSILAGSNRIKAIVDELRDFTREQPAEMVDGVDLNRVVQSAATLLSNMTRNATQHFSLHLAPDLPPIHASHQRLEQVAINLIQNALQALPDPACAVEVRTSCNAAARAVVLEVHDEGAGIAPAHLERVQDPFFTTRREQGGTGLGLSICAGIVMDHGGRMTVESELGRGTTVRVALPLPASADASVGSASTQAGNARLEAGNAGALTGERRSAERRQTDRRR